MATTKFAFRTAVSAFSMGTNTIGHSGILEASLLHTTSRFLLERYLGYDIKSSFTESACAYDLTGSENVASFISIHQFPYPVSSITANAKTHCVTVNYDLDSYLTAENIYFDISSPELKIVNIQSTFDCIDARILACTDNMIPRIHVCGGPDSKQSIAALKSLRILNLAMKFLKADVHQDRPTSYAMLAHDAVAFGEQGKEDIAAIMKTGNDAGTTYSVPFPAMVNVDANCVSLDFYAYSPPPTISSSPSDATSSISASDETAPISQSSTALATQQDDDVQSIKRMRGTDIMYVDIYTDKIVRIDTVRHTLTQPDWVKRHFST